MKIKSDKLFVELSVSCFIDAKNLIMYNLDDGSLKPYSEIEDDDIDNWILQASFQVMTDYDELELEEINICEAVN
jgi:hypothetical protein